MESGPIEHRGEEEARRVPGVRARGGRSATSVQRLKSKVRPVFFVIALGFIVYAVVDLYRRWDASPIAIELGPFLLACLLAALAMMIQLVAFRSLISQWSGVQVPFLAFGRIYMDSQMARYTPGKFGLVAVRVAGASRVGISPSVMAAALTVEVLSWCAAGVLLGASLLLLVPGEGRISHFTSGLGLVVAVGGGFAALALTLVPRKGLPDLLRKLVLGEDAQPLVPVRLFVLHLAHFLAWAVCGVFLGLSVGVSTKAALVAGALVPVSIIAGFLALFAPAGVGVREAVLTSGLASACGPSAALAIGLLSRIASLSTDVLLWLCFRAKRNEED